MSNTGRQYDEAESVSELLITPVPNPVPLDGTVLDGNVFRDLAPGLDDPISTPPDKPKLIAVRTSQTSDKVITHAYPLGSDLPPFLIAPFHRDRLRATLQLFIPEGGAAEVGIGSDSQVTYDYSWRLQGSDPWPIETRDSLYVVTGTVTGAVILQTMIELRAESCGCGN